MFDSYQFSSYTKPNKGNWVFSSTQESQKKSDYLLYIPSVKYISSLDEIILTQKNTLIVVDEERSWKPIVYNWLAHIYIYVHIIWEKKIPIYICDNHNHALYFWIMYVQSLKSYPEKIYISHIDQHSDLLINPNSKNLLEAHKQDLVTESFLYDFVHQQCHVGNFVDPFLHMFAQTQFQWIKSEYQLLELHERDWKPTSPHILDIDLDFRAPAMSLDKNDLTIIHTKQLMEAADIITIATSPYYLDQQLALDLLKQLLI